MDDREAVAYHLKRMAHHGAQAHRFATEEGGKTGAVRDLVFGINTMIDALGAILDDDA